MSESTPASRLLSAFESPAAAERFVERIRTSNGHDLDRIAQRVSAYADACAQPSAVLAAVARVLANEEIPLTSEDAIAGMAAISAAEFQNATEADAIHERARHERARSAGIRATPLWQEAAHRAEPTRYAFEALQAVLTPSDVDDLVNASASGSDTDREPRFAAALLSALVHSNDPRFAPESRTQWAAILEKRLCDVAQIYWKDRFLIEAWVAIDRPAVEQALFEHVGSYGMSGRHWHVGQTLLSGLTGGRDSAGGRRRSAEVIARLVRHQIERGKPVMTLLDSWLSMDRPAAGRFLTHEWSMDDLSDELTFTLVRGLTALGTKPAIKRLEAIRTQGGRLGERAAAALELLGATAPDGLQVLASAWRRAPTRDILRQFHERYVEWIPQGVPMTIATNVLGVGQPDERAFSITTPDNGYLFLEFDRRGRLVGWKFE